MLPLEELEEDDELELLDEELGGFEKQGGSFPIFFPESSVNQRFPSGPVVILLG